MLPLPLPPALAFPPVSLLHPFLRNSAATYLVSNDLAQLLCGLMSIVSLSFLLPLRGMCVGDGGAHVVWSWEKDCGEMKGRMNTHWHLRILHSVTLISPSALVRVTPTLRMIRAQTPWTFLSCSLKISNVFWEVAGFPRSTYRSCQHQCVHLHQVSERGGQEGPDPDMMPGTSAPVPLSHTPHLIPREAGKRSKPVGPGRKGIKSDDLLVHLLTVSWT